MMEKVGVLYVIMDKKHEYILCNKGSAVKLVNVTHDFLSHLRTFSTKKSAQSYIDTYYHKGLEEPSKPNYLLLFPVQTISSVKILD